MKREKRFLIPRFFSLFLTLVLILPSPASALHTPEPKEATTRTNLKESLHSGLEEVEEVQEWPIRLRNPAGSSASRARLEMLVHKRVGGLLGSEVFQTTDPKIGFLIRVFPATPEESQVWQDLNVGLKPLAELSDFLRRIDPRDYPTSLIHKIAFIEGNRLEVPLATPLEIPGFKGQVKEVVMGRVGGESLEKLPGFALLLPRFQEGEAKSADRLALLEQVHDCFKQGELQLVKPVVPLGLKSEKDQQIFVTQTGAPPHRIVSEEEAARIRSQSNQQEKERQRHAKVQALLTQLEPELERARDELHGQVSNLNNVDQKNELGRQIDRELGAENLIQSLPMAEKEPVALLEQAQTELNSRKAKLERRVSHLLDLQAQPAGSSIGPEFTERELMEFLPLVNEQFARSEWKEALDSLEARGIDPVRVFGEPFFRFLFSNPQLSDEAIRALSKLVSLLNKELPHLPPQEKSLQEALRSVQSTVVGYLAWNGRLSREQAENFIGDPGSFQIITWRFLSELWGLRLKEEGSDREVSSEIFGLKSKKMVTTSSTFFTTALSVVLFTSHPKIPEERKILEQMFKIHVNRTFAALQKEYRKQQPEVALEKARQKMQEGYEQLGEKMPSNLKVGFLLGREPVALDLTIVELRLYRTVSGQLGYPWVSKRITESVESTSRQLTKHHPDYQPWHPSLSAHNNTSPSTEFGAGLEEKKSVELRVGKRIEVQERQVGQTGQSIIDEWRRVHPRIFSMRLDKVSDKGSGGRFQASFEVSHLRPDYVIVIGDILYENRWLPKLRALMRSRSKIWKQDKRRIERREAPLHQLRIDLRLTVPPQDQSDSEESTHESWIYVFPLDELNRLLSSSPQLTPEDISDAAPLALMLSHIEGRQSLIQKAILWPSKPGSENLRYHVVQENGPSSQAERSGLEETRIAGRQRILEPWAMLDPTATLFVQEGIRLSPELEAAVRANGNRIERFPLGNVPLSTAGPKDLFLLAVKGGEERHFIPADQSTPVINFLDPSIVKSLKALSGLEELLNAARRHGNLLQLGSVREPDWHPAIQELNSGT